MSLVSARRHASLARELIAACGGLDEAAAACRLKKSRLAHFQDPDLGAYMPADVIAGLEEYCGRPIYSRALAEARPCGPCGEGLIEEACQVTEGAAALQRLARLAEHAGARGAGLSPRQVRAIEQAAVHLEDELRDVVATAEKGARK